MADTTAKDAAGAVEKNKEAGSIPGLSGVTTDEQPEKPAAAAEEPRSWNQSLKTFLAITIAITYFGLEIAHMEKCGYKSVFEIVETECDFYPAGMETLSNWLGCLCVAGLNVGFVAFLHNSYLCARKGRLGAHFFHTLMGGEEEIEAGEAYTMTFKNTFGPVVFLLSLAVFWYNTFTEDDQKQGKTFLKVVGYVGELACACVVLSALVSVAFEFLVAFFHFKCGVLENWFSTILACDRGLEEIDAVDLEEGGFEEGDVEETMHRKLGTKSTSEWLQVCVQWITFCVSIFVFWNNKLYWKEEQVEKLLEAIGAICAAGLVAALVSDIKGGIEALVNFRLGSIMSSAKSKPHDS